MSVSLRPARPAFAPDVEQRVAQLAEHGVDTVRVMLPDLNGVPRGKLITLDELPAACRAGLTFSLAALTDGLRGHSLSGPSSPRGRGHPDVIAFPDLPTLRRVPWDSRLAWCLLDLAGAASPRQALRDAIDRATRLGLQPVVGPELEFYVLDADLGAPRPHGGVPGLAYGTAADGDVLVAEMLRAARELELRVHGASHEFGRSQYEINLHHGPALDAADRAFLFKVMVKELATRHGAAATFVGKPFADDAGSGLHLHLSLVDADGGNVLHEASASDGLAGPAHALVGGLLEHAPALTALLAPTINAYKRFAPDAMVPLAINWGLDNRTCWLRVPLTRGAATRVELRAGDAAAHPHLALAAALHAGLDGLERGLEPPPPVHGDVSLPGTALGAPLPRDLDAALHALHVDATLVAALGEDLVADFTAMKQLELERFRAHVTDWEHAEYLRAL